MLPIRLSELPEAPLDVSQSGIFPVSDVPNDITYKLSLQQIPPLSENQNIQVKTASYTITKNDYNTMIYFNNETSTTVSLTIPNNTNKRIQPGYSIKVVRFNLGDVRIVADSGVTIYSPDGLYLSSQYSVSVLTKIDTNTWIIQGHLSLGFSPIAVVLTTGTSYTVPSGATTMKAWAIGAGRQGAGGTAYNTWSVSGVDSVSYVIGVSNGAHTTITYNSTIITGNSSTGGVGASFSGGDGGANGGNQAVTTQGGVQLIRGGAIGGNAVADSCPRLKSNDSLGGLFNAVTLSGQFISDCGDGVLGYGGFFTPGGGHTRILSGIGGGGWNGTNTNGTGGAVVLYLS